MVLIFVWQDVKRIENCIISRFISLKSVNGENVFVKELVADNKNRNFNIFDNAPRKFDSNFDSICSDILDCQTVVEQVPIKSINRINTILKLIKCQQDTPGVGD